MTQISDAKIGVVGTAHIEGGMHIYGNKPQNPPLHLPPRSKHFTDRKAELEKLLAELQPGHTVTLCGPGGIGKSALAAEALWHLTSGTSPPACFPDGVIWHDFYREPKSETALEHIARCFGEEPVPTALTAAGRALSGKKAVLLLDGTEDTDNLPAVLSVSGNCGVIVTSRRRRDAEEKREDIRPLEADEAVKLLRAWCGDQAKEENPARQICERLGGLPLAVRLAGRYLSQTGDSAAEYLEWLISSPFEALDPDKEHHRLESVPWLIEHSLKQVDETARQILAVCGILAFAPFSRQVMEFALEDKSAVRVGLNTLVNYGLLIRIADRWQVSHALIHTYARTRLHVLEETEKNLILYYLAFAAVQNEVMAEGFARLNPERPHILSLLHSTSDDANALNLLWAMEEYCTWQGHYAEFRSAVLHCIRAAQKLEDHHQEANCIKALGDVHIMLAEYEQARKCYEEAQPVYAQIGAFLGEANCIKSLGDVHSYLAEYKQARKCYEEARPVYAKIGALLGEANCIYSLGDIHSYLVECEQARKCYEEARPVYAKIRDRLGEVNCIKALGDVHIRFAEYEQARKRYEEARPVYAKIGARLGETNCIRALGDVHIMLAEYEQARKCYEEAKPVYAQIGARYSVAFILAYLGLTYKGLGELQTAREHLEQAIDLFEKIKSPYAAMIKKWLEDL
ncbi:MAG: tetratricopeptide repeat protein [Desulfococcaceae bacterium]